MEPLLELKSKRNSCFDGAKCESAVAYYSLLLCELKIYPILEDEYEEINTDHKID